MARYDVVIVGGGNAGISLAARLRRIGCRDVAIVAADPVHRYRPLLNYVAGGLASMSRLTRPMRSVIPSGCTWILHQVVSVHPEEREVEHETGERVGYNDLVLAPGLEPDLDAIPGLAEAMDAGWSTTAHLSSRAEDTWQSVRGMTGGRVVFTIPPEPAPCGGTALKPLFLACDYWREQGRPGRHRRPPGHALLLAPRPAVRGPAAHAAHRALRHHGAPRSDGGFDGPPGSDPDAAHG